MGLADQYGNFKKVGGRGETKLGGDERTIHEERRKNVSGILERARNLSAKEMGGKGCKVSLKKVMRLHARDLKREKCKGINHWCVQSTWH